MPTVTQTVTASICVLTTAVYNTSMLLLTRVLNRGATWAGDMLGRDWPDQLNVSSCAHCGPNGTVRRVITYYAKLHLSRRIFLLGEICIGLWFVFYASMFVMHLLKTMWYEWYILVSTIAVKNGFPLSCMMFHICLLNYYMLLGHNIMAYCINKVYVYLL